MLPQQYCLRWKYHHNNLQTMFSQLLERGCFCDVTLACEGQTLKAHRVVLSACSTYFDTILTSYDEKDPILIMKDVKFDDVKCLVDFMYKGEINVDHCNLASLLKTAEDLHIKGLAEVSWRDEASSTPYEVKTERRSKNNIAHVTSASSIVSAELTESQDSPPLVKRKRGRPPIDDEYLDGPKITSVSGGFDTNSGNNLVTVMMPDSDEIMEPDGTQWMGGNVQTKLDYNDDDNEMDHDNDVENENTDDDYLEHVVDTDPLDTTSCTPVNYQSKPIKFEEPDASKSGTADEEWGDVVKMNDYLTRGRRPQFWEEPFTKRVMDAIKNKDLEMKKAAEILGVSYGTLYGRYRDTYGCLKHPYRVRDMWSEQGPAEILGMLQRKIISLPHAAEMLNVPPISITSYLDTMKDWVQDSDNPNSWDNSVNYTDTNDASERLNFGPSLLSLSNSDKRSAGTDDADKTDREIKLSKNITISTSSPKNSSEVGDYRTSALLDNHPDITIINLKRERNKAFDKNEKINNNSNLDGQIVADI